MSSDLTTQAINAALTSNWPEAIKINLAILKEDARNVGALNRLARGYKKSGNLALSKKTYRRVLTIDGFNPIAQKNLKLLESLPRNFPKHDQTHASKVSGYHCQPQMFLEDPGKTKVVNLVNAAPASTLLPLSCGDQIDLLIKRRSVVACFNGTYLAALPDDLSTKLIKRISAGNRYEAFIKTVDKKNLAIFIREISRAGKFKNQPTFSGPCGYYPEVRPETGFSEEQESTPAQGESLAEEGVGGSL